MLINDHESSPTGLRFKQIASMLLLMFSVSAALKLFGFRRVYCFQGRAVGRLENPDDRNQQLIAAQKTSALLQRVNREYSLLGNSCLAESLALWWLLARRGIKAEFRIGVRTMTGVFESHAWVEYDGHALNEVDHAGKIFTVFDLRSLTGI
ncbi:MAG: lasso peptide biosynthesis B2 protein [Desulfobacterales bacterium]|nr:lasso peptide biosynthesis B2 protein [Desulfobacterales bacterium]